MEKKFFKVGDAVPKSGTYICVPCGHEQYFAAGDEFVVCPACMAGTPQGPERYDSPDAEFWKLADR